MSTHQERPLMFAIGMAAASAVAGCQTTTATPTVVKDHATKAAVCPKCEIVWFKTLDMNDPYCISYGEQSAIVCAECRSAIDNFFKTGRLAHACKTCDAKPVPCPVRGD